MVTASQADSLTPLSPLLGIGKYRFSNPLLESSVSGAGLLGSGPLDRLRKSLRGAGFTASQARFLRLLGRVRYLQRFPRFRFPLAGICEQRFASALLEAAFRVRFLKCAPSPRVRFLKCLRGWVSIACQVLFSSPLLASARWNLPIEFTVSSHCSGRVCGG